MSNNPTLKWERLQDRFYRNLEGYSMLWDIDLSSYIVASAPYGGAIALTRDFSKLTEYKGPESRQTSIFIYSGSGSLIHKIPWDNGSIKGMGWSESEHLLVISDSGNARCYYDFEGNFTQFSLGKAAEMTGVVECQFHKVGFVAMLKNHRFVSVSRYDEPNPKLLAEVSDLGSDNFHGWALVPPEYSLGQHFEVLIGYKKTLLVLDTAEVRDKLLEEGPFIKMAVSPNSEFTALFTLTGRLWVISSDFQRKLSEHDTKSKEAPKQLVWCGNDAVAVVWEDEINLIGPLGDSLLLLFDSPVHVFPEINGMRTLTNEKHDFFTKVPDLVVDIFKIGSTSPAAILRDCVDQLDRRSPKADENLSLISDKLPEAVDACIQAAGYEFEPYWQKKLLRAASFGKSAIELYNSDSFVQMCEYLRVLNTVRQFDVGILLDYIQLVHLTPKRLIDRLLIRRMHALTFKCAEYLNLPNEHIYVHWACTKIKKSDQDDETLCNDITVALKNVPGIRYEEIARTAYNEGRTSLAITLLQLEKRPDKQVPLLLDMQELELALEAAIKSYDVNLIVYTLITLQRKLSLAVFFRIINNKPVATKCFEKLCQDNQLLENFYYQDDRKVDNAMLHYVIALGELDADIKLDKLDSAKKLFGELKSLSHESKEIDEQLKLLVIQKQLEQEYERSFVGQTVTETISELFGIAQTARAQRIKDEFKVPDKRFWWIRLKVLVSRREWDTLYKFATSKKSPIGYDAFYTECVKAGSKRNAAKYIPHCTTLNYKQRIEMCLEVDDLRQACQEAIKAKDVEELERLQELTPSAALKNEITDMVTKLRK